MATTHKLAVFSHLDGQWAPCGLLSLTEEGTHSVGSSFAYGTRYLDRAQTLEIDPVGLALGNRVDIKGKLLLPPPGLSLFGGIRDCTPDAWGRRVIEAQLKVPPNSLPESTYLLRAGSDRVGALDVRSSLKSGPTAGIGTVKSLPYLLEAADRIEQLAATCEQLERDKVLDDGRPCVTDVFLAAAIEQLDDKWDFFEAVKCWCEGDWEIGRASCRERVSSPV